MTSALDGNCQSSLMLSACSADSSGKDLTTLRDVLLKLVNILVIDNGTCFHTEAANLFLSSDDSLPNGSFPIGLLLVLSKRHVTFLLSNSYVT